MRINTELEVVDGFKGCLERVAPLKKGLFYVRPLHITLYIVSFSKSFFEVSDDSSVKNFIYR
jgi:hypothetical protein